MFRTLYLSLLLLFTSTALADDLQQQLADAQFNFDLHKAEELLPAFASAAADNTEQASLDFATASLLVAELKRGVYESGELERKPRRALGREIDRIARAAIEGLQQLPESSERYRLQADLMSTMIRSKFQGMKYQPKVEEALQRAVRLDEGNASAWVSMARRPLFADPKQGGDLDRAQLYLDKALAIKPDHVQALLFRGAAYAKLGVPEAADADWARALELNPNTAGARDRLMKINMSYETSASQ
jgi:tetratricopeptide (TPR) repeat protein